MSDTIQATLLVTVYRLTSLLIGCGIVYMGYLLFKLGVFEKAGELKAAWGDRNLALRQAAPGTFFAFFGALVIVASLAKGLSIQQVQRPGKLATATPADSIGSEFHLDGLGGASAEGRSLSDQLRREMTTYAICTAGHFADTAASRCREVLTTRLNRVPLATDLTLIDSLESKPDSAARVRLDALRRAFIK